jgi:cytochrome c oxidase assembly factor CtaG/cytochrome c2
MRWLSGIGIAAAAALASGAAYAHAGQAADLSWSLDPAVAIPLVVAIGWYGLGLAALAKRRQRRHVAPWPRIALFGAGIAVTAAALLSPIDALADDLLSAHMVQHLLLMIVAAPLFVASRPVGVLLWALGPASRRGTMRLWRHGWPGRAARALCNPIAVWIGFSGAFIFWHIPGPYRWALEYPAIHALAHLCYFVTSLAFWATVAGTLQRPRLSHAATLMFIVTTALLSDLPGALLLIAGRPIYPGNAEAAAAWGLSVVQDQQLAGVMMWVPMGFAFIAAGAWAFMRWIDEDGRARPDLRVAYRAAATLLVLVLAPGLLGGCDDDAKAAAAKKAGGDVKHGAQLVTQYGCGGCHSIPGIDHANGRVGPPLDGFASRLYIAGMLSNTPGNLVAWIEDPQRIVPGNVMPNLGIREREAQDIATFLYTLR